MPSAPLGLLGSRELEEAATIDGAGLVRIFATIIRPLVCPGLATLAVFSFKVSWNSLLGPLVVIRSSEWAARVDPR